MLAIADIRDDNNQLFDSTVRINKKVYTFQKSPPYKYFKYIQEISIHVGSYGSLLSNDTQKFDDIVCLSEQGPVAQKFRKNQTQVKIKRKIKRNLRSIINRVAQNN